MSQATTLDAEVVSAPEPEIEPEPEKRYEIIDGRKVGKPPMGQFQILVAGILDQILGGFVRTHRLGRVAPEFLFWIDSTRKKKRAPDVAFISYARLPRDFKVGSKDGFDVAPELAIEVISPSNKADEVIAKIRDYFQAGVVRVWVVYPADRLVYVYESPTRTVILGEGDELDGGELLPGFKLSLAELFEDGA